MPNTRVMEGKAIPNGRGFDDLFLADPACFQMRGGAQTMQAVKIDAITGKLQILHLNPRMERSFEGHQGLLKVCFEVADLALEQQVDPRFDAHRRKPFH